VVLDLTVPRTLRPSGETGHGEPAPSVVRALGNCSSPLLSGWDDHVPCPRLLRFSRSLPAARGWSAACGSFSHC